jgi:hypothetical protein
MGRDLSPCPATHGVKLTLEFLTFLDRFVDIAN